MTERLAVFVLGHRGMLGHVVVRYLRQRGHDVEVSGERYDAKPANALIRAVQDSRASIIINCLGRIKQKSEDFAELFRSNTLLPIHLAQVLRADQRLLHASSDCVFSGARGAYAVDEPPDPDDLYGTSKMLGEIVARHPRVTVIRTSVIGPERAGAFGLLGWFLNRPVNEVVTGFTNHVWNGVTTLEWARIAEELMLTEPTTSGRLIQPATAPVTKFALLERIRDAFDSGHVVHPGTSSATIDRSLIPTHVRPPIETQLRELAPWYVGETSSPDAVALVPGGGR